VKFLHTGDWHLGKVLRGRARHDEQAAALAEVVQLVEREAIGLVLVAGDVFESAAPPAEAQRLAWSSLLALRQTGAEVVVVAGNHDNGQVFEAVRPVFEAAGITVAGTVARPDQGGVLELTVQGDPVRIALLPWLSPRQVVRAANLLEQEAPALGQLYSERVQRVLGALTAPSNGRGPAVEIVLAHAFVRGGVLGGGERDAQTINEYGISATAFPGAASYVALGHLHRHQLIPGPCPIWYAGSPIAVDFGEEADRKGVLLGEASVGTPARVEHRPLESARRLRTVRGTLRDLEERADQWTGDLLRVIVTEPGRAGLAEAVRELLPDALEVRVERTADGETVGPPVDRRDRTPHASFDAYLTEQGISDPRLTDLFAELFADELAGEVGER
jgi:exonuclease SbcD